MFGRVMLFLCAVMLLAIPSLAGSSKKSPTRYIHYGIAGTTAPEILASLHRLGPTVYGVNAYASTYAEYSQKGDMLKTAKSCKIKNFNYSMNFVVKLPKLKNEGALKGRTAAAWNGFEKFVRAHEDTHRQIWMNCAQKHANSIAKLAAPTCEQVTAQASKLWEKDRAACNARHAAFDASERRHLARQPLIRMALKGR
jgi:predicted secreted Zn-dependent protease